MSFLTLNNNWSNLAQYYNTTTSDGIFNNTNNVTATKKPQIPSLRYTNFDDGLVRGGVVNAGLASARDTARVAEFLTTGKGLSFITKQFGLQFSNPQLESLPRNLQLTGTKFGYVNFLDFLPFPKTRYNSLTSFITRSVGTFGANAGITVVNSSIGSINTGIALTNLLTGAGAATINAISKFSDKNSRTRIYSPLNTLAQVPVNAFGVHLNRHGLQPFVGEDYSYEKAALQNDKDGKNRLREYFRRISYSADGLPIELQNYFGGPKSVYGIGKTIITTTTVGTDLTKEKNGQTDYGRFLTYKDISFLSSSRDATLKKSTLEKQLNSNAQALINAGITRKPNAIEYNKKIAEYNIEKRIGTPNPNNKHIDAINSINITDANTFYSNIDKDIQTATATIATNATSTLFLQNKANLNQETKFGKDIIKFRIEPMSNEGANSNAVLAFRAYIDDFQDGMNAKWNPYRYIGRGEEFYVYEGFTRDISVAFTMFAHTIHEMKPLYRKLNYLMSIFAPDYSTSNKMQGNISYLTIGDYIYRQPGIFTDIKLSGMLDSHWEIDQWDDVVVGSDPNLVVYKNQLEVPKHIKINLSFKPIHTFLPRRVYGDGVSKSPFITPDQKAYPTHAKTTLYDANNSKYIEQASTNRYLDTWQDKDKSYK